MQEITREMREYKLDDLVIQKVRWKEDGKIEKESLA